MSNFINTPLFWFVLGIIFMIVEISHFGFVFFFFGIGAMITALIALFGFTDSLSVNAIIFLIISLLSLVLLRRKMSNIFKGKVSGKPEPGKSIEDFIGEKAIARTKITPGSLNCKVEYHGTLWEAQSDITIEKGNVVEITGRKNLTLIVKAAEK